MLELLIFFIMSQVELNVEGAVADTGAIAFHYSEDPKTLYIKFDPIFKDGFESGGAP